MIFSGVILSALVMLLLSESAQCRRVDCKSDCCSFVEGFPVRLKELRSAYREIQSFYVSIFRLIALSLSFTNHQSARHFCFVLQ